MKDKDKAEVKDRDKDTVFLPVLEGELLERVGIDYEDGGKKR